MNGVPEMSETSEENAPERMDDASMITSSDVSSSVTSQSSITTQSMMEPDNEQEDEEETAAVSASSSNGVLSEIIHTEGETAGEIEAMSDTTTHQIRPEDSTSAISSRSSSENDKINNHDLADSNILGNSDHSINQSADMHESNGLISNDADTTTAGASTTSSSSTTDLNSHADCHRSSGLNHHSSSAEGRHFTPNSPNRKKSQPQSSEPVQQSTWNWIHTNCLSAFTSAFRAQLMSDLVSIGINVIPIFPLWSYLPFGSSRIPCQSMTADQYQIATLKQRRGRGGRSAESGGLDGSGPHPPAPTWRERLFSSEGLIMAAALAGFVIMAVMDSDVGSAAAAASSSSSSPGSHSSVVANSPNQYSNSNMMSNHSEMIAGGQANGITMLTPDGFTVIETPTPRDPRNPGSG